MKRTGLIRAPWALLLPFALLHASLWVQGARSGGLELTREREPRRHDHFPCPQVRSAGLS